MSLKHVFLLVSLTLLLIACGHQPTTYLGRVHAACTANGVSEAYIDRCIARTACLDQGVPDASMDHCVDVVAATYRDTHPRQAYPRMGAVVTPNGVTTSIGGAPVVVVAP